MKNFTEYLYCCFYYLILAKHFRHARTSFLLSISITVYLLATLNYIGFSTGIYWKVNAGFLAIAILILGSLCTYFLDRKFSQRPFYSEAVMNVEGKSRSFKVSLAVVKGLLAIGSWATLIHSFLAFGRRA